MEKIPIGISSCLLGNKVRFDGNHRHDRYITGTLGNFFEFVPVCPEVGCGLGVPREAMRLVKQETTTRLRTTRSGIDHTDRMQKWISGELTTSSYASLAGFIFKAKSPSCGVTDVRVHSGTGTVTGKGPGLFAGAFVNRFPLVPVIDEGRLHDLLLRENFIDRVFVYKRLQDLAAAKPKAADLIGFHRRHKLLVMSHYPAAVARLGSIAASCKGAVKPEILCTYGTLLMETLSKPSTVPKHANVLQHIAGYFKKQLSPDEKQELREIIAEYRNGTVPLIAPITLIKHYTRLYKQPYLSDQLYLNPHPLELMLKYHA